MRHLRIEHRSEQDGKRAYMQSELSIDAVQVSDGEEEQLAGLGIGPVLISIGGFGDHLIDRSVHATRSITLSKDEVRMVQDSLSRAVGDPDPLAAAEFIEWLISLDDPENPEGLEERRSVTLTKIIDRARSVRR